MADTGAVISLIILVNKIWELFMRYILTVLLVVFGTQASADEDLQTCVFDASMKVEIARNDGDVLKASKALIKKRYLDWVEIFEQAADDIVDEHNQFVNPEYSVNAKFFPKEKSISNPKEAIDILKRRYAHLVGLIIFEERDPLEFLYYGADRAALTRTLWKNDLDVTLYQCFLDRVQLKYDPFNETDTKAIEQKLVVNFKQTKYGKLLFEQTLPCISLSRSRNSRVALKIGASFEKNGKVNLSSIQLLDSVGGNSNSVKVAFQQIRKAIMSCENDGFGFPTDDHASWAYVVTVFDFDMDR